jgi:hypothetical protein
VRGTAAVERIVHVLKWQQNGGASYQILLISDIIRKRPMSIKLDLPAITTERYVNVHTTAQWWF